MSLLYFHALLISCAVIFFTGFGVWELHAYQATHRAPELVMCVFAFVAGLAFLIYLIWFVRTKILTAKH